MLTTLEDYDENDLEVVGWINYLSHVAPTLPRSEIVTRAKHYVKTGYKCPK